MEYKKITNLLGGLVDSERLPKYTTIKWNEIYDDTDGTYNKTRIPNLKHQS